MVMTRKADLSCTSLQETLSDARPDRRSTIEGIICTEGRRISKPCFLMSKDSFGERRSHNEPSVCSSDQMEGRSNGEVRGNARFH
jgi:hypothetical protein